MSAIEDIAAIHDIAVIDDIEAIHYIAAILIQVCGGPGMAGTMTGKVALVTGAGSGIGRAVALAFGNQGVAVVVGDIDKDKADGTIELLRKSGAKAAFRKCDTSSASEVRAMIRETVTEFGRLDFACNNAGIHNPLPETLVEADEETWDRIMAVNLKGVFLCMKYEVEQMMKQGTGVIVNMASLSGLVAESGCYAYVASKHGILGLTKTAAFDYAKHGIRVNAVCPGPIMTPGLMEPPEEFRQRLREMTPVGRLGTPEEVAAAVMYLCSDLAGFVTGTGLLIDGGISTM